MSDDFANITTYSTTIYINGSEKETLLSNGVDDQTGETTGGSTTTAWEEFDKNRAFIRPERIRYELETGKDCCGARESPQETR